MQQDRNINENKDSEVVEKPAKLTKKEETNKIILFVLFSISAGVIQTLLFTLLNELLTWSYWPSYLIALIASVIYNFTINRKFTFKSANNIPLAMLQIALYYVAFTPLSTWWGEALTVAGWNEYIVLFFTMIINLITEYLFSRFVVYRKSINTSKNATIHSAK